MREGGLGDQGAGRHRSISVIGFVTSHREEWLREDTGRVKLVSFEVKYNHNGMLVAQHECALSIVDRFNLAEYNSTKMSDENGCKRLRRPRKTTRR